MNLLLIIAAIFIVTENITPEVDKGKETQKKKVVVETVETKPAEEINSVAQAAIEIQAKEAEAKAKAAEAEAEAKAAEAEAKAKAAEAEAKAKAEKEINYFKIALYIILILAILSGALLYFRKRDKSPLESKIIPPERKEEQPVKEETKEEQPIQEETQPETKKDQPIDIDNANKEPTNFEETNEDEKK